VIIAIASGKGGTGKTTLAVNLARTLAGEVQLLDCDVEAPNDHLFLRPSITASAPAGIPVPQIDPDRCSLCGDCGTFCRFNALALLPDQVMVFPELCHGCGGCALVCPEDAVTEVLRPIGTVEQGRSGAIRVVQGRLDVGEPQAPPLIRAVKAHAVRDVPVLIDAPPGTACPMITAIRGSDLALLVTEPTPFGLNDLALAVETARAVGTRCAVVINRAGTGDNRVHRYCQEQAIEVVAEIPDDRRIAEATARGECAVDAVPELRPLLERLYRRIGELVTEDSPSIQHGGPHRADL
jgi:MinD superfamily P-loop ATPase